jgi:hypothetical protein
MMAGTRKNTVADIVFEGVVIPRGTRSAKIARKGIKNEEDLGNFLTAIFSDTLSGEIVLPKAASGNSSSAKMLDGLEQKLKQGLPVTIQAVERGQKKPRKPRAKGPK